MNEPATDLAVACAIASSYFEQPIARDVALIGEARLGLGQGLWEQRCASCPGLSGGRGRVQARRHAEAQGASLPSTRLL